MFFFIASEQQPHTFIPARDFIYEGTTLFDDEIGLKYITSVYYSAMLFALSDIFASSTAELFFSSVMGLICAMITANIFGMIAVLSAEMSDKEVKFQE